jgi:uncharacterized protein YecT (DUF1311 family)
MSNVSSHMRRSLLLSGLLSIAGTCSLAEPLDPAALAETSRRTGASVDRIVKVEDPVCALGSMSDMSLCAEHHFVASDLRMREVLAKVKAKVRGGSAEAFLAESQASWLSYRRYACAYESQGYTEGSGHAYLELGCLRRLTDSRIEQLSGYLACNSAGCPE